MAQVQLSLSGFEYLDEMQQSADAGCVWCGRFLDWHKETYRAHAYNLEIINRFRDKCEEAGIDWEAWLEGWEPDTPKRLGDAKSKSAIAEVTGRPLADGPVG